MNDYMVVGAVGCVVAMASYALVGQVLKPLLRIWAKLKARKAGRKLYPEEVALFKTLTQSGAVIVGGVMGVGPIWPDMVPMALGPLLGLGFGSLAIPLHAVIKKTLPARVASIIAGKSVKGDHAGD
jgi:hypothetical protein